MKKELIFAAVTTATALHAEDRPNFLWLVSEDNSPRMGCYGDPVANTPNIDDLATKGITYLNAFANAPVCAPARNCIITGLYSPTMGTQHMRSQNRIPANVKMFPEYLRAAGYYTSNNSKEDYNTKKNGKPWNESSRKAHWRKRQKGQPFFSVFNFAVCHESCLHRGHKAKTAMSEVKLPKYLPDTPESRNDMATQYDMLHKMDAQAGNILKQLEKDGLAEDTIVFYYGDHGGVLPRGKRFVYDSGLRVPMIAYVPPKFQHLVKEKMGIRSDRIVTFVDLAPTILSLAGIEIPKNMQGKTFLGKAAATENEYAYGFRGRMDERYDLCRTVRDKRFRYIRNYMPHLPYAQYLNYLWRTPSMKKWHQLFLKGKLNDMQSAFFRTKPTEELYDLKADPDEVNNLAADTKFADVIMRMRKANRQHLLSTNDSGFIPEGMMWEMSKQKRTYDVIRDKSAYDLTAVLTVAEVAGERKVENLGKLSGFMQSKDPVSRYWGAMGCVMLKEKAASAKSQLQTLLNDKYANVRIAAAEALVHLGEKEEAFTVLTRELKHKEDSVALAAINVFDRFRDKKLPMEEIEASPRKSYKYIERVLQHILEVN